MNIETLFDRVVQRVNINLREFDFDVRPFVEPLVPFDKLYEFYGFYGITPLHPLNLEFRNSNLSGTYFLGKCRVANSILYKSDVRGDELKKKGDVVSYKDFRIPLTIDEGIRIEDSFLIKTLVHNYSHDPEHPEWFTISNTISARYSNIHGSPMDGSFLEPFVTVDLTTMNDCIVGSFSYVQAGEVNHLKVEPGTIWVKSPGNFEFHYHYPQDKLDNYITFRQGSPPQGALREFMQKYNKDFQIIFSTVDLEHPFEVPLTSSIDRFSVVKPETTIGENVLVSQRSYIENSYLGKGANAQENCYIINSHLSGFNVTAHGAKLIEVEAEETVFVGFNSFLHGMPEARIKIGKESIIMPHTIIDSKEPITIPAGTLVWGLINNQKDLAENSIAINELIKIKNGFSRGRLTFKGNGNAFANAFEERIQHILEANGAFYNGTDFVGHAQKNQNISFNTIQPYRVGDSRGIFPTMVIRP